MVNLKRSLIELLRAESGQNLIEYGLIAGLLALGAVFALTGVGQKTGTVFATVGNQLTNSL